jgi:hypothetical protein
MGSTVTNRAKEIAELVKELPDGSWQELLDFAQFLKTKRQGFSYKQTADSAEYVRSLRVKQGITAKSAESFIKELIEWQGSNS